MRKITSDIPQNALATIQKGTLKYKYKGVPCLKNPFDLCLYLKLIYELKPRSIIEIGSASGGSALWFADTLRSYNIDGHVYSVDLNKVMNTEDDRVTFLGGNALQLGLVLSEEFMSSLARPLLVIEDAAHTLEVTGAVLQFFKDHLKKSEYIIVEDGIVNDLLGDQYQAYDNGPNRAILSFLESSSDFIIDENYCDYYGHNFTWCTNGYLTKIA